MSTIARKPEMRKRRQPMMSGFQTRRSSWAGVEVAEHGVDQVDAEDAGSRRRGRRRRGSRCCGARGPPAPGRPRPGAVAAAVRGVDREQHRGVAAGGEEDAADEVDDRGEARAADVGLGEERRRSRRASRRPGTPRPRPDSLYGVLKVAGSGPVRWSASSRAIAAMSSSASSKSKTSKFSRDARGGDRLRDHDVAELQVPAQDDLGAACAVARGDRDRAARRRAASPWPSGLHASVAIPCSAC